MQTLFFLCSLVAPLEGETSSVKSLADALSLHASFDEKADADFGRGDRRIYSTPDGKPASGSAGLRHGGVRLAKTRGRHGGALEFTEKTQGRVYFKAEKNLRYRSGDWSGTVSFWLSLDPDKDLKPGYSDPIQITDKTWNKAALWVDFSKDEVPRHFRYGVFADFEVWNPDGRRYEDIPASERPWVVVKNPPFARGKWTHVVMTFSGFNRAGTGGVAQLYLDGKLQGEVKNRRQVFTWQPAKTAIYLGISYIGLMDDLAVFDRALSPREVERLYRLPGGVAGLYEKKDR